ncbi:MAG TPA: hypothetical protein VNQ79_11725 [Blastocatellia bacterium]|nr:hypothetical protein [Blastocatellia bacterium]
MVARIDYSRQELQTPVSPEEVRQVLGRVLSSRHFVHAPKKQKFIQLICDFYLNGRAGELNEYLIGREVFERDDSYNPAADPIVRVGAHDVRKKLELYYQNEGAEDAIRLIIPVGSYEPAFVRTCLHQEPEAVEPGPAVESPETLQPEPVSPAAEQKKSDPASDRKWRWLAVAGLFILTLAIVILAVINLSLRRQLEQAAGASAAEHSRYGVVWEPFLTNNRPTLLILSNPTVHRPVNGADPEVLTRKGIRLTPEQVGVLTSAAGNRLPFRQDQPVQLIPAFNMYTGIGEAIGIYRLSGLLHGAGEKTILRQSRSIGPDDLKSYDVILLGSVYSNQWSKPLSVRENFVYTSRATIENLGPLPGEEREYRAVFDQATGNLLEDYALITVTPGFSGDTTVMVLAGIYSEGTEAAAEFVTATEYLNELNQRLRQAGGQAGTPKYYQALLKVRVENSFPTRVSLLTVRELKVSGQ